MTTPRLDLLIYAHDGRGLGHVSRSAAIGLAVRRLLPELKVLMVTGSRLAGEFIHPLPLDWLKLPAYATQIKGGRSRGRPGPSGIDDRNLGLLRTQILRDLVRVLRPRCVLVDHTPQGKHRELLAAIESTRSTDTRWVLGVRGIVGHVRQVWGEIAQDTFRGRFSAVIWYGDANVLGPEPLEQLRRQFGQEPIETGYVSRLGELVAAGAVAMPGQPDGGVVAAIPWIGEGTGATIAVICDLLRKVPPAASEWLLFAERHPAERSAFDALKRLAALPLVQIRNPGRGYPGALVRCKAALIYGGYNSLTDVLFARIPALVLLRGMADGEQHAHARRLCRRAPSLMVVEEGKLSLSILERFLAQLPQVSRSAPVNVNLDGAANAARWLASAVKE